MRRPWTLPALLLAGLWAAGSWAGPAGPARGHGDEAIELAIDADRVGLQDTFTVTVSITGAEVGEPEVDWGGHFVVLRQVRGQSLIFREPRSVLETRYQYTVRPLREGVFDIGPAEVRTPRARLRSNLVRVLVMTSSTVTRASPGRSGPFAEPVEEREPSLPAHGIRERRALLASELSQAQAWVGEEVEYRLRLLTERSVLSLKPVKDSSFTGLWTEAREVPNPPRPEPATHGGRRFTGFLLRRLTLVPTHPGRFAIEPETWELELDEPTEEGTRVLRSSERLELVARALPAGAPPGFAGAVGVLEIAAAVEPAEVEVEEPVRLSVTIAGTGNLRTLPAPAIPAPGEFRLYEAAREGALAQGRRSWDYVLVPRLPGEHVVPALAYPYFDPVTGRYEVARSQPIAVRVRPGTASRAASGTGPGAAGGAAPGPVAGGGRGDITPPWPRLERPRHAGLPVYRRTGFQALFALPPLVVLGALAWRSARERRERDPALVRSRLALRVARQRIGSAARRLRREPAEVIAAEVGTALVGYLGDRLGVKAAGLTREGIALLVGGRLRPEEQQRLLKLLERCDYLRFTPAGTERRSLLALTEEASGLLKALERGLSREGRR